MAENDEEMLEDDIEIPELLENLMLYSVKEAKERMLEDGEFAPFTAVLVRDKVYFDTILGEDSEELYAKAQEQVESMDGLSAYAFCYDGWVDDDESDAIIAEGGMPGDPAGCAICCLYRMDDAGERDFDEDALFLGDAPNFAENLSEPDPWDPESEEE